MPKRMVHTEHDSIGLLVYTKTMATSKLSSDRPAVYGVPRRYDLVLLLVVSVAFATLFALLQAFGASSHIITVVLAFVVVVGIAQATLFGGRAPRRSSLIAGMLLGQALVAINASIRESTVSVKDLVFTSLVFALMGYFTGAVVGGVFLVCDRVRSAMKRFG